MSGALRASPAVNAHALDDELVLYDSGANRAYVLNASAASLWQLCNGSSTVDQAIHELADTYNRDLDEVTRDVVEFVRAAREAGLLLPDEGEPTGDTA